MHRNIEYIVAEDDLVAVVFFNWLVHQGEFQGMLPPRNKQVKIRSADLYRIEYEMTEKGMALEPILEQVSA